MIYSLHFELNVRPCDTYGYWEFDIPFQIRVKGSSDEASEESVSRLLILSSYMWCCSGLVTVFQFVHLLWHQTTQRRYEMSYSNFPIVLFVTMAWLCESGCLMASVLSWDADIVLLLSLTGSGGAQSNIHHWGSNMAPEPVTGGCVLIQWTEASCDQKVEWSFI